MLTSHYVAQNAAIVKICNHTALQASNTYIQGNAFLNIMLTVIMHWSCDLYYRCVYKAFPMLPPMSTAIPR